MTDNKKPEKQAQPPLDLTEEVPLEFVDEGQIPMPESTAENPKALSLEEKYAMALADNERLKNDYFRAYADAENAKRRALKDVEDYKKYAVAPLAREIFGVADTLMHATRAISADARAQDKNLDNLAYGLEMTNTMFFEAFARVGIKECAKIGDKFDPNLHQAVSEIPANDQNPAGTICSIMQQGFVLHDRLLRPAMVVVAGAG